MGAPGVHYTLTWLTLVALAGVSWLFSRVDLAGWAIPVALLIALAKASLIALSFMRLSSSSVSVRLVALAAAAMTALLVGLSVADVLTRESHSWSAAGATR